MAVITLKSIIDGWLLDNKFTTMHTFGLNYKDDNMLFLLCKYGVGLECVHGKSTRAIIIIDGNLDIFNTTVNISNPIFFDLLHNHIKDHNVTI
jgi:hypothetical protein